LKYFSRVIILLCIFYTVESCRKDKIEPAGLDCSFTVSYSGTIRPLVLGHCATTGCHVAGFQPGNFTLYQPLKDKADNGRLKLFVLELRNMPPNGSVTEEQRQLIGCWIEQGAPNN